MKRFSAAILLLMAGAAKAAPFDVTEAWFRALPGKLPAAGYFTAQNNNRRDIAITGAASDGCGMVMIHRSVNTGGMSTMAMMERVTVPAGAIVRFAPGGYHLMCEEPRMRIGARIPVVLHLSDGSAVVVAFQVRGANGK